MTFSRTSLLSFSAAGALCAVLVGGLLLGAHSTDASSPQSDRDERFAPALGREESTVLSPSQIPSSPVVERLRRMEKVTAHVRARVFDHIDAHPLVVEAAYLLATELSPYTREGALVTSLVRSPEDQWRLMENRRYRWWTTNRSKHLMGMAADIGFVRRWVSMKKLAVLAENLLNARLGEKAKVLRVVSEAHCLHIEIDTRKGRAILEARAQELENLGIARRDNSHPVPQLSAYRLERQYMRSPEKMLLATLD
ncbi:MAG: M15 family metallopeptidase [Deltaproteobacteria bacterium]|nr:M15 family metallopeptidase [Deltaproteobacteria bacterium]